MDRVAIRASAPLCAAAGLAGLLLLSARVTRAEPLAPEAAPDEPLEPGQADTPEQEEDEEYAEQNVIEVGGTAAFLWTEDAVTLDLSPTVGYFIVEYVELSAFLRVAYERREDPETGERASTKHGALILEPSYHIPLREALFLFGGLGLGVGYDGDNYDFEVIPRVGLRIGVGRSGELTVATRVPIITDSDGTLVGVGFEAGYSVFW